MYKILKFQQRDDLEIYGCIFVVGCIEYINNKQQQK